MNTVYYFHDTHQGKNDLVSGDVISIARRNFICKDIYATAWWKIADANYNASYISNNHFFSLLQYFFEFSFFPYLSCVYSCTYLYTLIKTFWTLVRGARNKKISNLYSKSTFIDITHCFRDIDLQVKKGRCASALNHTK